MCYDVRNKVPLRVESPKCRQRVVQNYQCARFISLNNNRTKANAIHTCKRKLADCQERIEHLRRPSVDYWNEPKKKIIIIIIIIIIQGRRRVRKKKG